MRKNSRKGIFAMSVQIVVIMLITGMFTPMLAAAGTSAERYQNAQEQYQSVQEQYQTSTDRVQNAQQTYQDAREQFLDAKNRFNETRSMDDTLALKGATRNYLNHTIDYTIKRIEAFRIRAQVAEENGNAPFVATDNIDDYLEQLENLKDDVAAAETREEFQAAIREIRDIWQHVHLESRYFLLGTMNNRVDAFVERSESISERIEAEIERLNEAGVDTTELQRLLDEYNDALAVALENQEKAVEQFNLHNGFDNNGVLEDPTKARQFLSEANRYMREAHQGLRDANLILREIFVELKEHRPGSADLSGTGTLTASGSGKATLSGDLEVEVSAAGGVLTITDYGGDAEIEVTGNGTMVNMGDGTVKYSGFNGTAAISGISITVVINGDDIELIAEGTGSVVLLGYGTYTVEQDGGETASGEWAPIGGDNA